ncbi:phage exclusion protein Lit [compost metagenome]
MQPASGGPSKARVYLSKRQGIQEVCDWFVALHSMPERLRPPPWANECFSEEELAGCETFLELLLKKLETVDLAEGYYSRAIARLPAELQEKLKLSDELVVGAERRGDINGTVCRVPQTDRAVAILIPMGTTALIERCCDLIAIHTGFDFSTITNSAFYSRVGVRESARRKLKRLWRTVIEKRRLKKKYPLHWVAFQLQTQLHRQATLGVVDVNDFTKEALPLPSVLSEARMCHPLEAGASMAEFACHFIMLHECAHILEHTFTSSDRTQHLHAREFEADAIALRLSVQSSRTAHERITSCLGAFVFLLINQWLYAATPESTHTHPSPAERINALMKVIANQVPLTHVERRLLHGLLSKLIVLFERLYQSSAILREGTNNTVHNVLTAHVMEGTPEKFLDTVSRWFLFGIPDKLCHALALTRVELEREVQSGTSRAAEKLEVLMKIYESASHSRASWLADELDAAYQAAKRNQANE